MNKLVNIFFCFVLISFISSNILPQNKQANNQKKKSEKQAALPISVIKEKGQFNSDLEESLYYSPIRYVIVYNSVLPIIDERRIEILFDKKSFNQENITAVFKQIAKRFPNPVRLRVILHTDLATIETPEEREMIDYAHHNRFEEKSRYQEKSLHSDAYYYRDEDEEYFQYYTSDYKRKIIELRKKPKSK